jgi:4-diphosphocytidyl-2-C-methyl-D-erythritol kinase
VSRGFSVEAPAKVNLRLLVLAREASGFHSLETIFCGLSLADRVEVRMAEPGIRLEVVGDVQTGPPEENLVTRAALRFYEETGLAAGVELRLHKRIPAAAGLGGGSSDAAATLRVLNAFHGHPCAPDDLLRWGALLGSDVPFFLAGSPLALAWGRGERLLELPPLPERHLLVAHPGVPFPTPTAFRLLADQRREGFTVPAASLPHRALSTWSGVAAAAVNDFEPVARSAIPGLAEALDALRGAGAEIALLCGNGAALFGIFPNEEAIAAPERHLRRLGFATWHARTLSDWPEPVPVEP